MQAKQFCAMLLSGCLSVWSSASFSKSAIAQDTAHDPSSVEVELEPIWPHTSRPVVTALSATRDGKLLAVAGDDHVIRLYRVDADKAFGTTEASESSPSDKLITTPLPRGLKLLGTFEGHTDWIQSLVFSSDSRQLFSSGNDGRILMWKYGQHGEPQEIAQVPYAVHSLSLSTQRQLLAVAGFNNKVGLFDLKASKWVTDFSCSCNDQRCVRFSPEGDKLLSGGRDGTLTVWNTETLEVLLDTKLHKDRIQTAAFSADGWTVTSAGDDRHLVRYDLKNKKTVFDHELKAAKLRSLYLINDHLIAVAGADNTIHMFDVLAEIELGVLSGHTGSVAVMGSASGLLVSGSFDTTVRLWKLESAMNAPAGIGKPVGLAPLKVDPNMDIR